MIIAGEFIGHQIQINCLQVYKFSLQAEKDIQSANFRIDIENTPKTFYQSLSTSKNIPSGSLEVKNTLCGIL